MSKKPLLIHTGTHGDESECIDLVRRVLKKYKNTIPAYDFIPEVSPTAVKAKTRVNGLGNDINRTFFSVSSDPEVIGNIKKLDSKKYDLFITFHEDWEYDEYYIYDIGPTKKPNSLVLKHNKFLLNNGVGLLNGLDDTRDKTLGFEFKDGYRRFVHNPKLPDDGTISSWILNRGIAKECLIPEIPQRVDKNKKEFIIESFFEYVLKPLLLLKQV